MRSFSLPKTRRIPYRPRLEALEQRCVPSAGDLDTAFGSGGIATTAYSGSSHGENVAIYPNRGTANDGKIVVTLYTTGGNGDFATGRYNPNGTLDTTFGTGGIVDTDFKGNWDIAGAVAIQSDGKVLVGGSARIRQRPTLETDFGLVRYNANGTLDTSFGGKAKGKVTTDLGYSDERVHALFVLSDGRILAVGRAGANIAFARYNSDGSPDSTFGSGGKVVTNYAPESSGGNQWAAVQADGKIVAALSSATDADFQIARFTSAGALDTTFGAGGIVTTDLGKSTDRAFSVAIQADGKIVVGGQGDGSGANFEMARYNTDGSLDTDSTTGFGPVDPGTGRRFGYISTPSDVSRIDRAGDVAVQSNGRIIALGQDAASGSWLVARFNADGSTDTTFHSSGTYPGVSGSVSGTGTAIAIQADGKVVSVGDDGSPGLTKLARHEGDPVAAAASTTSTTPAVQTADQFFADLRAVSLLLSGDDSKKH